MQLTTIWIISLILLCIMGISYLLLRVVQKRHRSDPAFVKKQQEREAEYRRKLQEDKELDEIAYSIGTEENYSDDDYIEE